MAATYDNFSSQLLHEVTRKNNAFLVNRKKGAPVRFSRDPMNLLNVPSFKYSGFIDYKAIGINAGHNEKHPTIVLSTKTKASKANKPAKATHTVTYKASVPSRKLYASIVSATAKKGYRTDLRAAAVSRASALKMSGRVVKERPAKKARMSRKNRAAALAATKEL